MKKRIAILGTVDAHRNLAPFEDPEWEIWVCSPGNAYGAVRRIDRWFELHGVTDMKNPVNANWTPQYFEWLNKQTFPVYMQEPSNLCPQALVFPLKEWLREFGKRGRINATSSISLMIGYAIMQRPQMIGVWGVDMSDSSEAYTNQKSGCLNMLALAEERGIEVTIPLESCLGTLPPLYGYAEASRMGMRMFVQETIITNVINDAQAKMNAEERRLYQARGALDQIQWFRRTFVDGELDAELGIEETQLDLGGGLRADVVHSKGTTVSADAPASAVRTPPVRVPDGLGPNGMDTEERPSGLLVPRFMNPPSNDNSEHPAEE